MDFVSVCPFSNIFQVPKSGEEVNLKEPDNLAYVYGGAYSPLTARLVEYVSSSAHLFSSNASRRS